VDRLNFSQLVLLTGIVATVALDLWQGALSRVFGVPRTNWALVGRWISHMAQGKFSHEAIGKTAPLRHEAVVGWVTHYVVGIIYAAVYLGFVRFVLGWEPGVGTALGFGIITVAAPWFLMQPAMGLGIMATKTPKPRVLQAYSLSSHAAFGAGLALFCASI
jgi:hypothetical protein